MFNRVSLPDNLDKNQRGRPSLAVDIQPLWSWSQPVVVAVRIQSGTERRLVGTRYRLEGTAHCLDTALCFVPLGKVLIRLQLGWQVGCTVAVGQSASFLLNS